jgi:hypothetical protein
MSSIPPNLLVLFAFLLETSYYEHLTKNTLVGDSPLLANIYA